MALNTGSTVAVGFAVYRFQAFDELNQKAIAENIKEK
jgi:hypothetical protein